MTDEEKKLREKIVKELDDSRLIIEGWYAPLSDFYYDSDFNINKEKLNQTFLELQTIYKTEETSDNELEFISLMLNCIAFYLDCVCPKSDYIWISYYKLIPLFFKSDEKRKTIFDYLMKNVTNNGTEKIIFLFSQYEQIKKRTESYTSRDIETRLINSIKEYLYDNNYSLYTLKDNDSLLSQLKRNNIRMRTYYRGKQHEVHK